MVPGNVRVGRYEVPVGLALIFLVLRRRRGEPVHQAGRDDQRRRLHGGPVRNLVATEWYYGRGEYVDHMEEFNEETADQFTPEALGLSKPERTLIAVHARNSLEALQRALDETDPEKTDMVVVATKVVPRRSAVPGPGLTNSDRATDKRGEIGGGGRQAGPAARRADRRPGDGLGTDRPRRPAPELWMGPGRWRRPEQLVDRIARAWSAAAAGEVNSTPLTVRIVGDGHDVRRADDVAGSRRSSW